LKEVKRWEKRCWIDVGVDRCEGKGKKRKARERERDRGRAAKLRAEQKSKG